jgi:hypothetical protein
MYGNQGDQIGRFFDQRVIVFFGQLSKNYTSGPHFRGRLRLCINFDENVLGYILGDFFTNSSGHSDGDHQLM